MAFNPDKCLKLRNVSGKENTFSMIYIVTEKCEHLDYKYYFSKDGVDWQETLTVAPCESVYVKGTHWPGWKESDVNMPAGWAISSTEVFDVISGSPSSLADDGAGEADRVNYCYAYLFSRSKVRRVYPLILIGGNNPEYGYYGMFKDCTELLSVPEALITVQAQKYAGKYSCCQMFAGCTKLTEPPIIWLNNNSAHVFEEMFKGCTSLSKLYTNDPNPDDSGYLNWAEGVSPTGDFYCVSDYKIEPYGPSRCPEGWTVVRGGWHQPVIPPPPSPPEPQDCFRIEILEDNTTISLPPAPDGSHYKFSLNSADYVDDTITANAGDIVYIYGTAYPSEL